MGQKVNPVGIRLGIVKKHSSIWYADSKNYSKNLISDLEVRKFIEKELENASVSRVVIERPAQTARITIHTARPGIVIGKKGEDVDKLRKTLTARMGVPVHINIEEIRKPDLDAKLVAQKRRPAAGASCDVPPRDEARGPERHASGRRGYQGAGRRPPGWR